MSMDSFGPYIRLGRSFKTPQRRTLMEAFEAFIAERRESDGGYAPVTPGDWQALHDLMVKLVLYKWEPDPDGDAPVEFVFTNRHECRLEAYEPIPNSNHDYSQAWADKWLRAARLNFAYAAHDLERCLDTMDELRRQPASESG